MIPRLLGVYFNGSRIGTLAEASDLSFVYSMEWLANPQATPISIRMPLQEDPYRGPIVSNYLQNLLPDSQDQLDRLRRRVGAASSRPFDLLEILGRDCVGALQFFPDGDDPAFDGTGREGLREDDVRSMIESLAASPLAADPEEDFRISIAGMQNKTTLIFESGKWYRPRGAAPTTHILKPAITTLPWSVENEWLCLRLCSALGLATARAEILAPGGLSVLCVERFDREKHDDGKIRRIPQEDFCQALGFPPNKKYEADGGPGIAPIMDQLNASDRREGDRRDFVRAQIAYFLLAAIDGHAKNFSTHITPTGFKLTPLYDVMSVHHACRTKALEWPKMKLAMAFGESPQYRLRDIAPRHIAQTFARCRIPQAMMREIVNETLTIALTDDFPRSVPLPEGFPMELFDATIAGVKSQATLLRKHDW